ncbi:hypothetical protein [Ferrimonas balearica]|uniref:hypothetical protein n=1 Tax=Ferrimonas balearica TaxID=44012 RepID=UPI001C999717|nr:hypothetical protein [Ferrimonas balearica]MBY5992519.1 hypothetical protein [Ferrimonas balearica]
MKITREQLEKDFANRARWTRSFALIGPCGAGKSHLLNELLGYTERRRREFTHLSLGVMDQSEMKDYLRECQDLCVERGGIYIVGRDLDYVETVSGHFVTISGDYVQWREFMRKGGALNISVGRAFLNYAA